MSRDNDTPGGKQPLRTLKDEDIVTARKFPRRSFLSTSGALLAGVAGIVSGAPLAGLQDPSKRPEDQPKPDDRPKPEDRPKPDDQSKPEDRPKPDERRKSEDKRRKRDDHPNPDDAQKKTDPHP